MMYAFLDMDGGTGPVGGMWIHVMILFVSMYIDVVLRRRSTNQ